MEMEKHDAFPNCPGLSENLGLQKASELPPLIIGWGPWKKRWYSICSFGRGHKPDCQTCRCGSYRNVWRGVLGGLVHDYAYPIWFWRANRPKYTLWQCRKERRRVPTKRQRMMAFGYQHDTPPTQPTITRCLKRCGGRGRTKTAKTSCWSLPLSGESELTTGRKIAIGIISSRSLDSSIRRVIIRMHL